MTPGSARAMYRRQMQNGEMVTLKRGTAEAVVRAKLSGYAPDELVGGITQGDRHIIMLAEDLAAAGWEGDPKRNDVILRSDGRKLNIENVDASTRRLQGETIAYDITARG
jgi:hypothetical protein